MNRQEVQAAVRPLRRPLVLAAEAVVGRNLEMPERTQLSHLVGICGEATCAEEIENFLRYQAGRGIWRRAFVDAVVEGAREVLQGVSDDEARVEAWRLYAVFLTRAHRYHDAARPPRRQEPRDAQR